MTGPMQSKPKMKVEIAIEWTFIVCLHFMEKLDISVDVVRYSLNDEYEALYIPYALLL
jgi:hypothetical protein